MASVRIMMCLLFAIGASADESLASATGADVLAGDDECGVDDVTGANECSLNALQIHATEASQARHNREVDELAEDLEEDDLEVGDIEEMDEGPLLDMANKKIAKRIPMLNSMFGPAIKAKHLDPMDMSKHQSSKLVQMKTLSGLSSLQLQSIKALQLETPQKGKIPIRMGVTAAWTRPLVIHGVLNKGQHPGLTIDLNNVGFSTHHVEAIVDMKTKQIIKFKVPQVHVHIGSASGKVHTRYFARMLDRMLSKKLEAKKQEVAGKIAPKITKVLAAALNKKCPITLKK